MIIEQPAVDVETIQSVSNANVSLKITFEFSTMTTTEELIRNIKYNMNVTTLGNISVATAPQLAIFESTGTRYPSYVTILYSARVLQWISVNFFLLTFLLCLQPICQKFCTCPICQIFYLVKPFHYCLYICIK